MREALTRVKRELGEQAVILGTRTCAPAGLGGLIGRSGVEITAATPDEANPPRHEATPPPPQGASPPALPEHIYPYYQKLVQNEVAQELAARVARQGLGQHLTHQRQ